MVDHQLGQPPPGDQDDLPLDAVDILLGLLRESRGRQQHALPGPEALHAPGELLHVWATNRILPSLRLDAHNVQPQLVLFDDPVDATVAGTPNGLAGVNEGATVAHRHQQFYHQSLEELGGGSAMLPTTPQPQRAIGLAAQRRHFGALRRSLRQKALRSWQGSPKSAE